MPYLSAMTVTERPNTAQCVQPTRIINLSVMRTTRIRVIRFLLRVAARKFFEDEVFDDAYLSEELKLTEILFPPPEAKERWRCAQGYPNY